MREPPPCFSDACALTVASGHERAKALLQRCLLGVALFAFSLILAFAFAIAFALMLALTLALLLFPLRWLLRLLWLCCLRSLWRSFLRWFVRLRVGIGACVDAGACFFACSCVCGCLCFGFGVWVLRGLAGILRLRGVTRPCLLWLLRLRGFALRLRLLCFAWRCLAFVTAWRGVVRLHVAWPDVFVGAARRGFAWPCVALL